MPTPTTEEWQEAIAALHNLEISVLEDFVERFNSFKEEMTTIISSLPNTTVKSPLQVYFERFGLVMNTRVSADLHNLLLQYGLIEGEPIELGPIVI